jgi:glutamyl-tRNA synthetase
LEDSTTFHDAIRGDITFEHHLIQDAVLLKSDGWPTYHLAAVVDDHFMEISHIMRGDEWVSSVPLGVLLYGAFGWEPPVWAHLPVILNPNGKGKMKKREIVNPDGTVIPVYVKDYQARGYLPEAMVNFLANIGWSLDGSREVFSRDEAIASFDIDGINPAPAAFPFEKLEWLNGVYIRQLDDDELYRRLLPFVAGDLGMDEAEVAARPELRPAVPLIKERIRTLADAGAMLAFLFAEKVTYDDPAELIGPKMTAAGSAAALQATRDTLAGLEPFDHDGIEAALRSLAEDLGLKVRQLFSVIRVAVTGTKVSPPLFESLAILGQARVLDRLEAAEAVLASLEEPA